MKIPFKTESPLTKCDEYHLAKESITSFTLQLNNATELDALLTGWKWGWGTLASEFVNLSQWIDVLNKLDESLRFIIDEFGSDLLISMIDVRSMGKPSEKSAAMLVREQQCNSCLQLARTILHWTTVILERGVVKTVYYSMELINLFVGAFDDELARSALRLLVALAMEPPCHRTVFIYENRNAFLTESLLSNSMFDILAAAGGSGTSLNEVLATRGIFCASRSRTDEKSTSSSKGIARGYESEDKELGDKKGSITNASNPHNKSCEGIFLDHNECENCEGIFLDQNECEKVSTIFPARVYMHSKGDGNSTDIKEEKKCSKFIRNVGKSTGTVANVDVVIGNWKGLRISDVADDKRSLKEIILTDFVSVDTNHEYCLKCTTATVASVKSSDHDKNVIHASRTTQDVSSWTKNSLCLLWRLRFIRSQSQRQNRDREQLGGHRNEGCVSDVIMYYQAVFILCVFHTKLERLDIFAGRGGIILADLMSILDTGNPPKLQITDSSSRIGQEVVEMNLRVNSTPSKDEINKIEHKIEQDVEVYHALNDAMSTVDAVAPLFAVSPELTILACQCLIVILRRAEEFPDEYDKRREMDLGPRLKQMVSFEGIQRDLGLEKGQMGGRLIVLLKKLILLHAATDIPALVDHMIDGCDSNSDNDNHDNSSQGREKGRGRGRTRKMDVVEARAMLDTQYQRLLLLEQYLSLTMCCLPLKGALSTMIDNGMLSTFRAALSAPMQRQSPTDPRPSSSSSSGIIGSNREQISYSDLYGHCSAVLEMSLCIDSYITQVLDMIVDSKKRGMLDLHALGGCDIIIQRLKFEARRPPLVFPSLSNSLSGTSIQSTLLPLSRQSLLFSLLTLTENLLNPLLIQYLPPPQAHHTTSSESYMRSPDIVLSNDFSCLLIEVLNIAPKGCVTLLSACLSLIETLTGGDTSHPKTLTHFLSCGLVKAAWMASCRPDMAHEEDSLMSVIELVASLCVTTEGFDLVLAINPFPIIFRNFHDPALLLSETATLVSCVPEILGRRLGELVAEYPLLLSLCSTALLSEMAHIATLALTRNKKRCILEEEGELVRQPNDNASVDQGDMKAFYFSLAVVRCFDQLAEYDGECLIKKMAENDLFSELMKYLLIFLRVAVGSESYLLTSLSCRGINNKSHEGASNDPNCEHGLFINSFPGFPPLVMALIGLLNKAWLACPEKFSEIVGKEIKVTSALLRKKLTSRLGSSPHPFHGLLDSVSLSTENFCNYIDPLFSGTAASMQDNKNYTEILGAVTYLSQLVFVLSGALKHRRSRFGGNTSHNEEDEADLDGLFGSVQVKKERDNRKKEKKNSSGTLQNILNDVLEGDLFLSCVKEQIRGHVDGLWDTAAKCSTGEEDVAFQLLVIWSRVTVKTGPGADFKRISRIEEGCTLRAERRLAFETEEGKASFCLSNGDSEKSPLGGGTGTGMGTEKWVSAYHPTAFPPSELVNVISVGMKKKCTGPAQKESEPQGKKYPTAPKNSSGAYLRSPVISFQMAGAAALSLLERSVQELISVLSSKLRSEASKHRVNPTDAVEFAGALLRPFAVYLPFTTLHLTLGIIHTSMYTLTVSDESPDNSGKLMRLISYAHGLRLCSHLIFTREVGAVCTVNELALMRLVTYGNRTAGDHNVYDECGYTFDDDEEFFDLEYSAPDTGNLLEYLLICSVRLFTACLPEADNPLYAPADICEDGEAVEEEMRCVSLAAMTSVRGVLHFWLTILQYISASNMTPTEKAMEAAYDTEEVFSTYRLKMTLCEVLMRKDNLPSLWNSSRLSEYPRAITETVCKLLQEAHRAVYRCVSYSRNLEKSADDKLKKKTVSLTVGEAEKKEASGSARNGSKENGNADTCPTSSGIPIIQALENMARSFADLGKGMEAENKDKEKEVKEMETDKKTSKEDTKGDAGSAGAIAEVAKGGQEEGEGDPAAVYVSPYAAWIGGDSSRPLFNAPKVAKAPKKDPPTVQSANYKKKVNALRFLIPMSLYDRTRDMKMNNSGVYGPNCDESWPCYSFLFRDVNEGPAWQLQVDTCGMFLRLLEGECARGRGGKNGERTGKTTDLLVEHEKDHWLWPPHLVSTDKYFPRTFFALRVMELVHISCALHIPSSITKAAKLMRQELNSKMEHEFDGEMCPARTAEQSYSCAIGIITWLIMRLSVLLPQAVTQPAVLSTKKWRSAVSGLLLGFLNLITGGVYRHNVSPAHQEGLILLITTHSDFKPLFAHLVTAIEEQNKLESQNLKANISTSSSTSTSSPAMVRLGGDCLEDAWVMTGLQILDYVTQPFLPCDVGIIYAAKHVELKRIAVRAMDQCINPIKPCGNFSAPLLSDENFLVKAEEWRGQADALYPPESPGVLASVVTYSLRQELGPRILQISLHILRYLPNMTVSVVTDFESAGNKVDKGELELSIQHSNEESMMIEAYRTCLQVIVHAVHDPSLAVLFCSLSGLETVLALPPVPGGPLAVVDILHSCTDSPRTISQRMAAVAVVIIQKSILLTSKCGPHRLPFQVGVLSPMIPREPLIAYQVIRDMLNARTVSANKDISLPLCGQFESCVDGCEKIKLSKVTQVSNEVPTLPPSDSALQGITGLTEAVISTNSKVTELSDPLPVNNYKESDTPFAYSNATPTDTTHITRLLLSRIDSLCSLCVSGTTSSEKLENNTGLPSSMGRRVCVPWLGKGAEEVIGTGVEGQLIDCLNILADLLHCMPSRSSSISLGRECVGQEVVEGAVGAAVEGAVEGAVGGPYTWSNSILESSGARISGSLINYLIQTILLSSCTPSITPSSSSSSSTSSSSTSSSSSSSSSLIPCIAGVASNELGVDGFSSKCQTAVVYLLCSLLSNSGPKRISHDANSDPDEVIQRGVFLALIGGFERCLHNITREESEEKVGRRLKGLRALSLTVYWTLNRVDSHKFSEPPGMYGVIRPRAANTSCSVSDLPLPLLDVIVKACTFATIHIENPSAAFCIQSLLHCSTTLFSYHGDQSRACSNDDDVVFEIVDPSLSENSMRSSQSSSTCSQNDTEEVEEEVEAEVDVDGLDLLPLFSLIESEVTNHAERLLEQHQVIVGSECCPSTPAQDSSVDCTSYQGSFAQNNTTSEGNGTVVRRDIVGVDDADFDFGFGEDRIGMNAAIMESLRIGSDVHGDSNLGRGHSYEEDKDKEEGDWSDVESEVNMSCNESGVNGSFPVRLPAGAVDAAASPAAAAVAVTAAAARTAVAVARAIAGCGRGREHSDGSSEDSIESDIPPFGGDLEDDEEEDDESSNKGWEVEDSEKDSSMYSYLSGEDNDNEDENDDGDGDDDREDNTEGTEDMAHQGWSQGGGGLFGNNTMFAYTSAEAGFSSDDDALSGSGSEEESEDEDSDVDYDDDSDDEDTYDTAEHDKQEEIDDDIFFNRNGRTEDVGDGEDRDEEGVPESQDKFGEKPTNSYSNLCNPMASTWGSHFPKTLQDTRFASQKSAADFRFDVKKEERGRHFSDFELSGRRWGDFGSMGRRVVRSPYATLMQRYLSAKVLPPPPPPPPPPLPLPSASTAPDAISIANMIEEDGKDDGLHVERSTSLGNSTVNEVGAPQTMSAISVPLDNSAPELSVSSTDTVAEKAPIELEQNSSDMMNGLQQPLVLLTMDTKNVKSDDAAQEVDGSDLEKVGLIRDIALKEVLVGSEGEGKVEGERVIVRNLFEQLLPDLHLALLHVPPATSTSTSLSPSNPLFLRQGNHMLKYAFVDQYVTSMLALLPNGQATWPCDLDEDSVDRFTTHLCSTTARIQSSDPVLHYRTLLGELDATSSGLDVLLRDKLMEKLRGDVTERLVVRLLDSSNSIWKDCCSSRGLLRIAMWRRHSVSSTPTSLPIASTEEGGGGKEDGKKSKSTSSSNTLSLNYSIEMDCDIGDTVDTAEGRIVDDLKELEKTISDVCVTGKAADNAVEHTFLDGLLRLLVHPSLSSAGRVLAMHDISRIVKSANFYSSHAPNDSLPPTLNPTVLARYSPDMTVSEESISGMLYIAVHDVSNSRDQRSFNDLFRVIMIDSTNWYRILSQLVDIADAQIKDLTIQLQRTLALMDSELRFSSGSPDISFLFPPDGELRLLRVVELMTSLSGVINDSTVSSSHKSVKAMDGSEEDEMKIRQLAAIAALRLIHDNALWADLSVCLDRIKYLDDRSSLPGMLLPATSNTISQSLSTHSGNSSTGMTSSPMAPSTPPIALSPAQCMQQLLVKPTYVLSPLSHGLVPLLECFFRSVCADLHAHALVQALPAQHNSLDQEIQQDLSATGSATLSFPPRTPSFTRTLSRIHAGTPFVTPPLSSKGSILAPLTTFTSCTFRTARTTSRPVYVLPKRSTGSKQVTADSDTAATIPVLSFDHLSQFSENNRSLLNALVRQNIRLLEGSLLPLLASTACRKILDFDVKRAYLKLKLKRLRRSVERDGQWTTIDSQDDEETIPVEVERERIIECSYDALQHVKPRHLLRGKLDVMFENEDGVDGGGLTREWYSLLMREIFRPSYALFLPASNGVTYQPNPNSGANPEHLEYFRLVGIVIGKAISDGQLLDAHFTRPIYKHILGVAVSYHDLEAIEPEYYKSLCLLLSSPLVDLGFEDSLSFSADSQVYGESVVVDLIDGGRNVSVTDSNKSEYVRLIAHHRMTAACRPQLAAFLEGFHSLIPLDAISFFDPLELELLISGLPDIDIDDLKANTEYFGYKSSDPTITLLWTVVRAFSKEEQALFVQFFSGTSKVPLDGFAALQGSEGVQRFSVHKAFDPLLLPTAHTCFNQLDLPEYPTEHIMRAKLLLAIRECSEGFGFV